MGYVAVTVGFAALGAYLGRDLSGGAGLVLFIGAFGCIFGLNGAAAKGREQLAIGLLLGLGLLLGFAVAPVIADYARAAGTERADRGPCASHAHVACCPAPRGGAAPPRPEQPAGPRNIAIHRLVGCGKSELPL